MPMRWRKPRQTHNPEPIDLSTLRTELNRATDVAEERVAAIIDDRLDGYHADLLEKQHDLMSQVISLTVQVRSMERRAAKNAMTARNERSAGMTAVAAQFRQASRHTPPRTVLDEPF